MEEKYSLTKELISTLRRIIEKHLRRKLLDITNDRSRKLPFIEPDYLSLGSTVMV